MLWDIFEILLVIGLLLYSVAQYRVFYEILLVAGLN